MRDDLRSRRARSVIGDFASWLEGSDRVFMMIKNLIWDFDGTLFNTYPAFTRAFEAALAKLGHRVESVYIAQLARVGLAHCAAQLADHYGYAAEELMRLFQEEYSALDYESQEPMPYAADLCRYVLSCLGCNVIVTHRGRKSTAALLRSHGMDHLIQDIIAGDDGYPRKPDPGSFDAVIKRNDLIKEVSLAIGDRELDAEAGRLAGLRTCILGHSSQKFTATYFVSNLNELKQIMLSENTE